ncbi:MAG: hypothetical protein RLZZ237_2772 [Pseudomonadota bacterium]|jgi:two-component system OmpR family response regulator/two-component system response regulator RstA
MPDHLLLIEDDVPLAALTAQFLRSEGFRVSIVHRGDEAAAAIERQQPALAILDVMLPGLDGFSVCRQIRAAYPGLILMLTALDENHEQLTGFDAGADDFVVKPVDPLVLLARIRAMLRRHPRQVRHLSFGSFSLDLHCQQASLDGRILHFSTAEFELLAIFARHAGLPLGREVLLQQLRGLDYDGSNRSVDMRVSRLRKKLGALDCPVTIRTVMAQGYLFSDTSGTQHAN